MADHIPFAYGGSYCKLVKEQYAGAAAVRVPLRAAQSVSGKLPNVPIWVDAEMDGFDQRRSPKDATAEDWRAQMSGFMAGTLDEGDIPKFLESPKEQHPDATAFVDALLTKCKTLGPAWISIPQRTFSAKSANRKLTNRMLCKAAAKWKQGSGFGGKFILPVIIRKKGDYTEHMADTVRAIESCVRHGAADGIWVVDSSLVDDKGTGDFAHIRFPKLIELHARLRDRLGEDTTIIAGPYWCLNLVLWARGLVDHPAVGVGRGYQYFLGGLSGAILQQLAAKSRVALPPLRRRSVAGSKLVQWLKRALYALPVTDPAHKAFAGVKAGLDSDGFDKEFTRPQLASFYGAWLRELQAAAPTGRALLLYQQLSSAYVIGKELDKKAGKLPDEGTERFPAKVAQQHMLHCL